MYPNFALSSFRPKAYYSGHLLHWVHAWAPNYCMLLSFVLINLESTEDDLRRESRSGPQKLDSVLEVISA